jgi:hypothetical protein
MATWYSITVNLPYVPHPLCNLLTCGYAFPPLQAQDVPEPNAIAPNPSVVSLGAAPIPLPTALTMADDDELQKEYERRKAIRAGKEKLREVTDFPVKATPKLSSTSPATLDRLAAAVCFDSQTYLSE